MKKIKKSVPAKLNLTLDVFEKSGNFHQIESLVASIDVCDTIIANKRKDGKITLSMKGHKVDVAPHENNAFKAASLFMQNFPTTGVDVKIIKRIPIGGGLGGSSADIAGVLLALKELYGAEKDVSDLAAALGSDAAYMTKGGYAVMYGRGEKVRSVRSEKVYYALMILSDEQISAGECYKEFDNSDKKVTPTTKQAERALNFGDDELVLKLVKNDLADAAKKLAPEIAFNLECIKRAGANAVTVAGSGPTVFGLFIKEKDRNQTYKKLKPLFGDKIIKAKTIPLSQDKRNAK